MKKLLHLVGCLHRCTDDARSHKHQINLVTSSHLFQNIEASSHVPGAQEP